jgi:hypothetical protein
MRLFSLIVTTLVVAFCRVAVAQSKASAEPIIFVISYHNLDYAETACEMFLSQEAEAEAVKIRTSKQFGVEPVDWVNDILAGVVDCKSVRDMRELGRRLENELTDALAVTTLCAGVTVIRDPHPKYDGNWDEKSLDNQKIKDQKPHWDLHLDYRPGQKIYSWALFPEKAGGGSAGPLVEGEGATPKVAEQICIVVTGRGATIR